MRYCLDILSIDVMYWITGSLARTDLPENLGLFRQSKIWTMERHDYSVRATVRWVAD